ncbi:MAG TPA: 4-hydroxy-tetrahydrodipicolinate synthase [Virgibacillus sp.]|nr:4-hydroxy-tetrahydrodipicolinate synthase [Virgibacillus sp.]
MGFGTVLTAMVTPFDTEGNIDFDVTTVLIEDLLANGTEGLVVAGTTGESPTLLDEEKIALFKHVIEVVNKRVPVIAGTGNNNTAASITLTKEAEVLGADAIMLVTPYYNRPDQQGLYMHFSTIAEATTLPVMLYNIPGRSVVNMDAETTIRLSKIDNIVSVKEASGDLDQVSRIIEHTSDDFSVYSGDDSTTLPIIAIGGNGVVSVASHVIGNEMSDIVRLYMDGQNKEAAALHRKVLPIIKGLFKTPSPAPVKAALKLKGIDVGHVRLPLVDLSTEERATLKDLLHY